MLSGASLFPLFAKFNNSLELSELNNWHILKVFDGAWGTQSVCDGAQFLKY